MPLRSGRAGHKAERLQKVLAQAGLGSRREVEAWIRAGRLSINGETASLGARAAAGDRIRLDGRPVRLPLPQPRAQAFLCHRSPGEPLATAPAASTALRPGIVAQLPRRAGRRFVSVSPMPRIDGGLELLTPDGALAALLQRAVHSLASEFSVRVRGPLTDAQRRSILAGELDSGAQLRIARCDEGGGEGLNRWYSLAASGASGKQVRQLFERHGAFVSRVLRTRLGSLALPRSLARGRCRALSQEELEELLAAPAAAREG